MSDILLLVASRENRRLLADCLQAESHHVHAPDPFSAAGHAALDEKTWELCIVDGPVLSEHWWQVKLRRVENEDEFLPFLLVTSHQHVTSTTRQLWRLVDEVILTPIEKDELLARVEILLRAQRYPRRWSERYDALTDLAPVGIVMINTEGRVTYANARAEQMLDDGGKVVGRPVESWRVTDFEGNPCSREKWPFYRVMEEKRKLYDLQQAIELPSGERVLLSVNTAPLFDEEGQLRGVLCSVNDVTERERRVQELREAKEEAEEMNRLKSSFLANMSHEIRTPLTGILGFAEILAEQAQGEQREIVEVIQQSGERLHDTLTSLLDLSQLESGTLEMHPSRIDANAELGVLCQPFAMRASERGLKFELHRPESAVEACLDRSVLTRIVNNLLSNALKFTREGSVTVVLEAGREHLNLAVTDTGVGIEADFLPELFTPFKQESSGLGRDFEGNGLGLAITRELVTQMGGTIKVESQKHVGTTFTVVLPLGIDHAPSGTEAGEKATSRATGETPPRPAHVLIVEDNDNARQILQRFLGSAYDVTLAATAEEALDRVQEHAFDAVILDINLGAGMNGEGLLHALRRLEPYQDTPMLALTAHGLPDDREHFLRAGFDGFLSKPFKGRELRRAAGLLVALGKPCSNPDSVEHPNELLNAAAQQDLIDEYTFEGDLVTLRSGQLYLRATSERALPAIRHLLERA